MNTKFLTASALIISCVLYGVRAPAAQVTILEIGDILTANYYGGKVLRINPVNGAQESLGAFSAPTDLALTQAGDLYVGELAGAIKRLTLTNSALASVGPTSLTSVRGLVLDPVSGDLFVTGRTNTVDVVMRVNPVTQAGTVIAYGGSLSLPVGIEILDSDHLVVACWSSSSIVKVRISDGLQTVIVSGGDLLDNPWGLAVFGDLIYTAHFDSKLVTRIAASTLQTNLLATAPGKPFGMGVDDAGNVLVGTTGNVGQQDMVARFSPSGTSLGAFSVGIGGSQQISGIEVSRIQVVGNRPPVPASPYFECPQFCSFKMRTQDLLGTDPEGDTLAVNSVDSPTSKGGSVLLIGGWAFYSPPVGGLTTMDTFVYTVSDGNGNLGSGVVTLFPAADYAASLNISWDLAPGGGVRITGSGIPQRIYTVEYTEDPYSGDWLPLEPPVTADEYGIFEHTDLPPEGSPARFYRTWTPCQ